MKTTIITKALLAAAVVLGVAGSMDAAQARGCIKGAIVGGVAGHMAGHHGVLGAAGGCAVGHHMASQREKEAQQQRMGDDRPSDTAR